MKHSVASVLAVILAASGVHAQEGQPVDPNKPVHLLTVRGIGYVLRLEPQ